MKTKRKTPIIVKILALLLIAASLVMVFLPWLRIIVDIPMLNSSMTLEKLLNMAGQSVDSTVAELQPKLEELTDTIYDSTGVTVETGGIVQLVKDVFRGNFSPVKLAGTVGTMHSVLNQFMKAVDTQTQSDASAMSQVSLYLPVIRQAQSSFSTWTVVLWVIVALLGVLGLVALISIFTDHPFGLLPYLLLSAVTLTGTLILRSKLNSSMSSGMQLAGGMGADMSALNTLGVDMTKIFHMGIAAYLCVALALLAFLLMFIKERKPVTAPMAVGYAPSPYPARQSVSQQPAGVPSRPAGPTWTCPNCGSVRGASERFCGACGGKKPEAPAPRRCANCGKELPNGALFCSNCGQRLNQPAPTPVQTPAPVQPSFHVPGDEEL